MKQKTGSECEMLQCSLRVLPMFLSQHTFGTINKGNQMASCSDCKFYKAAKGIFGSKDEGECNRFPPQIVIYPDSSSADSATSFWPKVSEKEWCGEFSSKQN